MGPYSHVIVGFLRDSRSVTLGMTLDHFVIEKIGSRYPYNEGPIVV